MTIEDVFAETNANEGFLNDIPVDNWDDIPDATFDIDDGTYKGYITNAQILGTKDEPNAKYLVVTYKVTEPEKSKMVGKEKQEWKRISPPKGWNHENPEANSDDLIKKREQNLSFLKTRLVSLGVPTSRFKSLKGSDLMGLKVIFTLATKKGYQNFTKVELDQTSTPTPSSTNPF